MCFCNSTNIQLAHVVLAECLRDARLVDWLETSDGMYASGNGLASPCKHSERKLVIHVCVGNIGEALACFLGRVQIALVCMVDEWLG